MKTPRYLLASLLVLNAAPAAAQVTSYDSDADGIGDDVDHFPCDGVVSAVAYAPGQGQHDMLMFEDQWPAAGDLDFNDIDLAYNFVFEQTPDGRTASLRLTLNFLAHGGDLDTGVGLHLPVATSAVSSVVARVGTHDDEASVRTRDLTPIMSDSELTVILTDRARDHLELPADQRAGPKNCIAGTPPVQSEVIEVEVTFGSPLSLSPAEAPFDLFIFRTLTTGYEVHRTAFGGTSRMDTSLFQTADDNSTASRYFVDHNGLPFALIVPDSSDWPLEGRAIDALYPDIVGFATSGGTQNKDYYQSTVVGAEAYREAGRPTPRFLAPSTSSPSADTSCVARCDDGVRNGYESDVDCGGECASCPSGAACQSSADCGGNDDCRNGVCTSPSCSDGIQNNNESDTDCGGRQVTGPQCPRCADGRRCRDQSDCSGGECWGGFQCRTRE